MNERAEAHTPEDGLPRRNTDPLWLQDQFLTTGHDVNTRNGTGTFVTRRGRPYILTCRHVLAARLDSTVVPGAPNPTLALHIDRQVLNLSTFTAEGLKVTMVTPEYEEKKEEVDIAISPLTASHWDLLTTRKNKVAIDLDAWQPPKWERVRFGLAAGYSDEHKTLVIDEEREKVANRLIHVIAEFTSPPKGGEDVFRLYSQVEQAHGFYFSGLSGGPLYAVEGDFEEYVEDDSLKVVGITFEGSPASRNASPGIMGADDIYLEALALTPERLDEWLSPPPSGIPVSLGSYSLTSIPNDRVRHCIHP